MQKKVIHLSQSDIRFDSRIIKEMSCIAKLGLLVIGIGVDREVTINDQVTESKIKVVSLKINSRSFRKIPRIVRYILTFIEMYSKMFYQGLKIKPHLIHCHDYHVLPIAILLRMFTKAKVIYDAHELESNTNGLSPWLGKIIFWIERLSWKYIDELIVVSPSIEDWYRKNIGYKSTTIILNAPHFENNNHIKTNYLREFFSIPEDSKIFIYVGMLVSGRGINLIRESFKSAGVTASVVFLGEGELMPALNQDSKKFKNIYVHKRVAHDLVVPIVTSADYGLCLIENVALSDYYCLPNKFFEYIFAGIPVLASRFPDMEAIIEQNNVGVCCDLELDEIIKSINKMNSIDLCKDVDFESLSIFSWQAQEQKLNNLYMKLFQN
ncbi:glycosyltransferase [Alcaligenaceae bacterium]|nr:glycosyltransferase [Alcaligenaceae bacterium]